MGKTIAFGEILEVANDLSFGDQEALIEVLHRCIIERRREEVAADIEQAQQEFQAGQCRPITPSELGLE